ncbi:RND transporter [Pararobbsia alpina]|uniref:efflux transporter outer membrane subunit n=1 Tax=Pararobbsia alpina TaxID=621374 RepID=UPI0039A761D7
MKRTVRDIVCIVGIASVAACTIRPETPAPIAVGSDTFRHLDVAAPLPVSLTNWPALFNDATLTRLVDATVNGNYDLKAANARIDQARALLGVDRSALFPTVGVASDYSRARASGTVDNALPKRTMHNWVVPVEADYELDLWGKLRGQTDVGKEGVEQAIAQRDAARLNVATEVASDYLTLRFVEQDIDALQRSIELRRVALEVANYRVKAGTASDLDSLRASSELDTAAAELSESERTREDLVDAIAVLTGIPPMSMQIDPTPHAVVYLPGIPVGMPASILEQRPDLFAAARQLDAASLEVGIARTAWLPTITLSASGGFASRDLSQFLDRNSTLWGLGITATETLFDGGKRDALVQLAQANVAIADANYRQVALVALRDVQAALNSIAAQKEREVRFERASTASSQAARLSLSRYQHGYVSYLEVIDADRDALNVERQLIHSRQEEAAATVGLVRALGGGWTSDAVRQEAATAAAASAVSAK